MENKNILNIAIVLTVGVILAGSLLMPVISDATTTEETITNKGVFRMTDINDPYSITYDPIGLAFIINDTTIPFTDIPAGRWTIISTDAFMFRFQAYASEDYSLFISDTSSTTAIASTTLTETRTWTFDNGTYTGYDGSTTREYTASSFRGYDPDGDYVMTNGTDKPIVKGDSSIIIGHGLTMVNAQNTPFYIYGTVNDGVTVNTKTTVTVSNIAVNATPYSKLADCFTLNSITFTAAAGSTSVDATYDRIIVPAEITAERTQHLAPGEIALINTLPIMVIVALLMVAVGGLYLRRSD